MSFRRVLFIFLLISSALPLQAATVNDYYLTGFDLYARKDYAGSIPYMKAVVQQDPKNWKASQILGYDYYLTKQPALALEAFDQSLQWHPQNGEVRNLAESIRAWIIWDAERRDIYPRVFRNYNIWFRLHAGVMTASLGDLSKTTGGFKAAYSTYNPSATVDGFGYLGGLEVGFMLDTLNAWGIVVDGAAFNGYKASASDTVGNYLKQTVQPNMVSIQAEYYHYFKLGAFRLYANAGGGFYNTIANLNFINTGFTEEAGEMSGLGYGGFLGMGFEMAVADQLSASAYVRGRYATTGNIQGSNLNGAGANQLMVLSTDPNGVLGPNPSSLIGSNGYKAVNIDYTGADFGISITYHY